MTEPSQSLAGRTMLVTGASSGIGKAIALAAARAGADVAFTYRTNDAGAREVERAITAISAGAPPSSGSTSPTMRRCARSGRPCAPRSAAWMPGSTMPAPTS